jgi:teichuronic acid biosynthesis glycosyltransferase TuaC
MKILVLSKRQYTNKDLLDDCYGRLFEIPMALSKMGNEVICIATSYRRKPNIELEYPTIKWNSINCLPFSPLGIWNHYQLIGKTIENFKPDLILCSSDAWHIILTAFIAKRKKIKFFADFYDNYESFLITKIPFVKLALRISTSRASGISCVSNTLAAYLKKNYPIDGIPLSVIGNGVDREIFFRRAKSESRKILNLPGNAKIIGTAGSLFRSRGINVLFRSFELLSKKRSDIYLLIAGPRDIKIPAHEKIIDMGVVPSKLVPLIYNSLDVCIVCNIDSDFGRFCHPQKFEEMAACEATIITANVGELGFLLKEHKGNLYEENNPADLAEKIEHKLACNHTENYNIQDWYNKAVLLNKLFITNIQPTSTKS